MIIPISTTEEPDVCGKCHKDLPNPDTCPHCNAKLDEPVSFKEVMLFIITVFMLFLQLISFANGVMDGTWTSKPCGYTTVGRLIGFSYTPGCYLGSFTNKEL